MSRRWPLVVLMLPVLVSTACSRAPVAPTEQREETRRVAFQVEIGGGFRDRGGASDYLVELRTLSDPRLPVGVFMLLPKQPLDLEGGAQALPGVILTKYSGDGRYVIDEEKAKAVAAAPTSAEGAAQIRDSSRAWLELLSAGRHYQFNVGRCTIDVRGGGDEGDVTCPRLRQQVAAKPGVEEISARFSWQVQEGR